MSSSGRSGGGGINRGGGGSGVGGPRTNARMVRVDRNWTKSGVRLFSHGRGVL